MPTPLPPPAPPSIYYPPTTSGSLERGSHTMEQTPKPPTGYVFCLNVIQNFTQLCLGGIVVSALIIANMIGIISRTFLQHIVLCTVGYFVLMAQAIISFSPIGWTNSLKYENRRIIHSVMQILGSSLAIAGCFMPLAETETFTFESSHGICGFTAMILTIFSLIVGVLNLIFHQRRNKLLKILHLSAGAVTITMAFIAILLAFHIYFRTEQLELNANANLCITITVLGMIGTVFMAFVKIISRILD